MIAYVPIETCVPSSGGLVVSGSAPLAASVLLTGRALSEMAGEAPVGEVTDCRIVSGSVYVRARVTAANALAKVQHRVLNTIAVIAAVIGDQLAIERVALVDCPDALGKRSGALLSLPLSIGKGVKMPDQLGLRRIEFGKTVDDRRRPIDPNLQRVAEAPALAIIKDALRQVRPANDAAFLSWYRERTGR
jgi:hypothetical protein